MSSLYEIVSIGIALVCAGWCIFIFGLQTTGLMRLWLSYSSKPPKPAVSPTMDLDDLPHVTVIRPVKGLEPELYNCLAATFRQTYPPEKLTIFFCVASASDPSYPVLKQLLEDFPAFDATILVEQDDPNLSGHGGQKSNLGPNPKIRNMSRAYREAKGDIVWIIDCNVWVGKGVGGRMVDKLCGFKANGERATPYKLVHLLPIVVDTVGSSVGKESQGLSHSCSGENQKVFSTNSSAYDISSVPKDESPIETMLRMGGGRLEEMYMASSHGKFYTGINTAAVVPCIVGKSTMFRRSHLNALTSGSSLYSPGIDYFSDNICEDHLFGDLLWFKKVPEEEAGAKFKKHGMLLGDLAIQPMAGMSVKEYIARRVRWLRVRKWTVMFATLIEPGIEPFLCSSYGAFAATTLPWFETYLSIPPTWQSFALIWITTVTIWLLVDTHVYSRLHSGCTVEVDDNTPSFARRRDGHARRPPAQWLLAWFGRETLTLPIWLWACLGGTSVMWRGRKFRVGLDTKVREIKIETTATHAENGRIKNKDRND